MTVDRS